MTKEVDQQEKRDDVTDHVHELHDKPGSRRGGRVTFKCARCPYEHETEAREPRSKQLLGV